MGNAWIAPFLQDGSALDQAGNLTDRQGCSGWRRGVRPQTDYTNQHRAACCFVENYLTADLVTTISAVAKTFLSPPRFSNPDEAELWLNFGVNVNSEVGGGSLGRYGIQGVRFGFPQYRPQFESFISHDEYKILVEEITAVIRADSVNKSCCTSTYLHPAICGGTAMCFPLTWPCFVGACVAVTMTQTKIYTAIREIFRRRCPRGQLAIVSAPHHCLGTPAERATDSEGNLLGSERFMGPPIPFWPPEGNNLVLTFTGEAATRIRAAWGQPAAQPAVLPVAAAAVVPTAMVVAKTTATMSRGKGGGETPKFCSQCGSSLAPGVKFCSDCGCQFFGTADVNL